MSKYHLDFYTSHHQFYLADKLSPARTDSEDFWNVEASQDRLAVEKGILGIGTECYGPVKGELNILFEEPETENFDMYDHVVEGSVEVFSGILNIIPCPDNEPCLEMNVAPATYRVRIYSSNLGTVEIDEGDDYYKIEIWPQSYSDRKVLKRWSPQ
jgi:hypothetical protein